MWGTGQDPQGKEGDVPTLQIWTSVFKFENDGTISGMVPPLPVSSDMTLMPSLTPLSKIGHPLLVSFSNY